MMEIGYEKYYDFIKNSSFSVSRHSLTFRDDALEDPQRQNADHKSLPPGIVHEPSAAEGHARAKTARNQHQTHATARGQPPVGCFCFCV